MNDKLERQNLVLRLESMMSLMMRWGVVVVGLLLFCGWISELDLSSDIYVKFHEFQSRNFLIDLNRYWIEKDWSKLLSFSGVFLLMSLPIFRVVLLGGNFLLNKEYWMGLLSALVLFGIIVSFIFGAIH